MHDAEGNSQVYISGGFFKMDQNGGNHPPETSLGRQMDCPLCSIQNILEYPHARTALYKVHWSICVLAFLPLRAWIVGAVDHTTRPQIPAING